MIGRAALVRLKQHKGEIAIATGATLLLAVWGTVVNLRLSAIGAPDECFEIWRSTGPGGSEACSPYFAAWGSIMEMEASRIVGAMAFVPFAVGLLSGVPIVGRELEGRTAQLAWSLYPSRAVWLRDQAVPVVLVVGTSTVLSAVVASAVQGNRELWGESIVAAVGLHGGPAVARAFAGFGVGLLLGGMLRRTLPAFGFGVVFCLALTLLSGAARDRWLGGLPTEPIEGGTDPHAVITGVLWRTRHGELVNFGEARRRATEAGVPPARPGDVQDLPALEWFEASGYREVPIGVRGEVAAGWGVYDAALFGLTGASAIAASIKIVNTRRP